MVETRKLAAIMAADIVGYSRLTHADEDRTLARLRALRSDLLDPTIAAHNGRIVKRTGDGAIVEFRSVIDAVNCAREIQNAMRERNAGLADNQSIVFRIGIHLGDVIEEADGDLMGDGVNIAARLESVAKPGSICLSESAYWHVKSRLNVRVDDLGPTLLKNIAEPVRVFSVETSSSGTLLNTRRVNLRQPSRLVAAAMSASLLVMGGLWFFRNAPRAPEIRHLSLVVLPFTNLSGDSAQDYFADGVTENLTTELARIDGSFVIASSTAFAYKQKPIDATKTGAALGVRYLLEGSVQRGKERVRVDAQLIDTHSGAHLWAGRFDESTGDLFHLQDQLVSELANTLGYELLVAEAARGARSINPDAIDLTMRAFALLGQWWDKPEGEMRELVGKTRSLFAQAIQLDPSEADALAGTALTHEIEYSFGWKNPLIDYADYRQGEDPDVIHFADRALSLAPANVTAYLAKSAYLQVSRKFDDALRVVNTGIKKNPNSALLLINRVHIQNMLGRFDQGKADAERAIRLSPQDYQIGWWHTLLGDSELGLGHFDAAVDQYRQDFDATHRQARYLDIAAAFALKGDMSEARAALDDARRAFPGVTINALKYMNCIPKWYEGLRMAGVPEE